MIHEKYQNQPSALERISLAQFATSYERASSKIPNDVVFENGASDKTGFIKLFGTDDDLLKYIELKNGGFMKLPSILRIHSSKRKKGNEGLYAELLLFSHWRSEKDLKANCLDLFNENYEMQLASSKFFFN